MSRFQARRARTQAWLAMLLAWAAGFVDAVGYIVLIRVFTAHMSGNSIAMGAHFGRAEWAAALHSGFPIPLFVGGVVLGTALMEILARLGVRWRCALALGLEVVLLVVFVGFGNAQMVGDKLRPAASWEFYLLAALLPLAMGLQNATLRRVGGSGVRTTFISGTLTTLGEEFVHQLFWLHDRWASRRWPLGVLLRVCLRQRSLNHALVLGGIWLGYVFGAIVGACAELTWQLHCLAAPIACLVLVICFDLITPIAERK